MRQARHPPQTSAGPSTPALRMFTRALLMHVTPLQMPLIWFLWALGLLAPFRIRTFLNCTDLEAGRAPFAEGIAQVTNERPHSLLPKLLTQARRREARGLSPTVPTRSHRASATICGICGKTLKSKYKHCRSRATIWHETFEWRRESGDEIITATSLTPQTLESSSCLANTAPPERSRC
jgi:hypothetical protein